MAYIRIAKLGITLLLTLTHAMSCIFPIIGILIALNINVLIPLIFNLYDKDFIINSICFSQYYS